MPFARTWVWSLDRGVGKRLIVSVGWGLPVEIYGGIDPECRREFDAEDCVVWQFRFAEMAEAADELVVPDFVCAVAQDADI
jgi:hypothetical protein